MGFLFISVAVAIAAVNYLLGYEICRQMFSLLCYLSPTYCEFVSFYVFMLVMRHIL